MRLLKGRFGDSMQMARPCRQDLANIGLSSRSISSWAQGEMFAVQRFLKSFGEPLSHCWASLCKPKARFEWNIALA